MSIFFPSILNLQPQSSGHTGNGEILLFPQRFPIHMEGHFLFQMNVHLLKPVAMHPGKAFMLSEKCRKHNVKQSQLFLGADQA